MGIGLTMGAYEQGIFRNPENSVPELIEEQDLAFTFYENLYNSSVTVIEGVYERAAGDENQSAAGDLFFVQLGSFSRKESADGFRAEVILEGYMTSDIIVQSIDGYHRVVLGPFAHQEEAELAMNWANERLFSSLLITR